MAVKVQGDSTLANNGVFYPLGDQLGSPSMVISSAGQLAGELRYREPSRIAPCERRGSSGAGTTDYRHTGQREEAGIGLHDSELKSTSLAMTRIEETINFTWPADPGGGCVGCLTFTVRWAG